MEESVEELKVVCYRGRFQDHNPIIEKQNSISIFEFGSSAKGSFLTFYGQLNPPGMFLHCYKLQVLFRNIELKIFPQIDGSRIES